MLKLAEAVRGGFPESASRTAKFEVPAVHGAPSIVPSVPRVNPVGKEPEATLQEKGGTPPDSCGIAVYALPPTPAGGEVVLIEGGGTTVSEAASRSEEHTSELQSHSDLVCRLLLEKKK